MTRQTATNLSQSWTSLFTAKSCFVSWFGDMLLQNKTEKWPKKYIHICCKGDPYLAWRRADCTRGGEGRRCCVVTLDGKLAAGWQRRRQKERWKQAEEELREGRMPHPAISPHRPHLRGVDFILPIELWLWLKQHVFISYWQYYLNCQNNKIHCTNTRVLSFHGDQASFILFKLRL